jgi:thermopsin
MMSVRRLVVVSVVVALALVNLAIVVAPPAAARVVVTQGGSKSATSASPTLARTAVNSASLASTASRAALAQSIIQRIKAAHGSMKTAFLPNFFSQVRVSDGFVQPLYSVAPAPMGIGDFGVRNTTGTPTPYDLQSTSWEGVLTLNDTSALYLDSSAPDVFGSQLNTVLTNTTVAGNSTNQFWIQNVIDYSTLSNSLSFMDNIWNFSTPSFVQPPSTFYSYCPNGTSEGGGPQGDVYYWCPGPTYTVPFPFTLELFVNSSLVTGPAPQHYELPTVTFGFAILNATGATIHSGIYDIVHFNSRVTSGAPTPKFEVNGFVPSGTGFLLEDSELMICGPWGGSTTTLFAIDGSMQLKYLSGTTYVNDPTAWNEGTDTGETVEGMSVYYTTPGTVMLSPGPSIPMPLWNATPGGNMGKAVVKGTAAPSNSFFFFNQGSAFNQTQAAWAPVPASGQYSWAMPPGTYYVETLASNYDPNATSLVLANGTNTYNVMMTANRTRGIYAPLWAWNNAQLANISSGGAGTPADPYLLDNDQFGPLDPLFGEFNDYVFPVFSGIFLAYTDASVNINQSASFYIEYPSAYARALAYWGLPKTNRLPIQAYDASNISIWQGSFTGWFSSTVFFGVPIVTPDASIAFWNVTHSLIGASTFTDLGSAIFTTLGGGNTIWGNAIVPGVQLSSFYPAYPVQLGIQVVESGDLIYNNYVTADLPAYALDFNPYTGLPQVFASNWNLSAPEPASDVSLFNGYALTGSIAGSDMQCGNFWGNYLIGSSLPYNDSGYISEGGDWCPYPIGNYSVPGVPLYSATFTQTGLTSGNWSVTVDGMTQTADVGTAIVFQLPNGTWSYSIGSLAGLTANPASGNFTILGGAYGVTVSFVAALTAVEGAWPSPTDVNAPVDFTATPAGGSGNYTYAWAFGDGGTSTDQNPTYSYAANGTYNVTLWVNDTFGASNYSVMQITVDPLPEWTASASVSSTDVGRPVDFTSTYVNGTEPYTFAWDFGDGSVSSDQSPGHTYGAPGVYLVLFEITDAAGVSSSTVITIHVNALPRVTATASTGAPLTGESVSFTGLVIGGSSPLSYSWSFGDGATNSSQNASHAFASPGTYTVTFQVNDSAHESSATTLTVIVSESSVTTTTAVIGIVAAFIVGVVVAALVLTLMARRRKKPSPPETGEQGGTNPPPSP